MEIKPRRQVGAVLMDGSALFFAARDLYPGVPLDYEQLTTCLREAAWSPEFGCTDQRKTPSGIMAPAVQPYAMDYPPSTSWIMWTSTSSKNEGQARFLKHVHGLGWDIRSFSPTDSFMVDPSTTMSLSSGTKVSERLTRFDASIGYMIGRLAQHCQIILLSDSFALAEPLVRAAGARYDAERRRAGEEGREPQQMPPNILAFFGRALDPRWFAVLRDWKKDGLSDCVSFLDLDTRAHLLMGQPRTFSRPWLDPDIPDRRTEAELNAARLIELEQQNRQLRTRGQKGGTSQS